MPAGAHPVLKQNTYQRSAKDLLCHVIGNTHLEKEENYFCILKWEYLSVNNSSQSPLRTGQWLPWHSSAKGTLEVVGGHDRSSGTSAQWGRPAGQLRSSTCLPVAGARRTRRTPTLPSVSLHTTGNSFTTCSMIPWWVLTKSHSVSLGVCEKGRRRHTRRLSCSFVRCTCVRKEMTWRKEVII